MYDQQTLYLKITLYSNCSYGI